MAFLCVDIGGTNSLLGIGNGDFKVIKKLSTEDLLEDVDEKIEETLEDTDHSRDDLEKVAIAAAGPINREKKTFTPPNLSEEGLQKVDLGEAFSDFQEIHILNDGTAAAVGEYNYGDHDTRNLVYLTISSGIGAGVILNGEVIQAWDGNFGEVGHMKINEEGPDCGCGGTAHWEAYSSGDNLPDMAEKIFDAEYEDALEIFEAYEESETLAERTIYKMHEANITGVTNIINVYNPEKIIFGGAIPLNHEEMILKPLREGVEDEAVNKIPEMEICSLGERSVIHGLRAVCNGEFKPSQL